MNIDYYESAEDITITRARAIEVLEEHSLPLEELPQFDQDLGRKESYQAQHVLAWLGY